MDTKKVMTAKEFDTKYWQDNDPFKTPLWKELRAYHEYRLANSSNVIHDISGSLPDDVTIKDLKLLRNYFGRHDKSLFEHRAFALLDSLVNHNTNELHYGCPNCKKEHEECEDAQKCCY